jgi:hypothetical protein
LPNNYKVGESMPCKKKASGEKKKEEEKKQ